jgi:hypothetical protein
MKRKINKIINIANMVAPILGSRDIIGDLKKIILKTCADRVDLNFKKVQFISRSAAHELLKIKEELFYRYKKEIRFINTEENVEQMLRVVASSRAIPQREAPKLEMDVVSICSLA